jgi:hypothetical protein
MIMTNKQSKYQQSVHDHMQARAYGGTGYRVELRSSKWAVISRRTNAKIISCQTKAEAQKRITDKQEHSKGDAP